MEEPNIYLDPFMARWCRGSPLLELFSEKNKAETWRQLWIWLAEAEHELGLNHLIKPQMIEQLKEHQKHIDWALVRTKERELKHDVMAHIHVYGQKCPDAAGIIHLGATSCFVQDNGDLIIQRTALEHIMRRLAVCLHRLAAFALEHASVPTIGRTHYQSASLTTVGKRAALWADGLLHAFKQLQRVHADMRFRGVKGAVGTQDTLMHLFKQNSDKVNALDALVTEKAGFKQLFPICGQTYPRYQDSTLVFALTLVGSSAEKFANDLRMLQAADGEVSEPFEANQVGSSAMPYKRNPIKCERIAGIARYLESLVMNCPQTYAHQGFERTLDDSSNRRIVIPQAFLAAEAILLTLQNILEGLTVNKHVVKEHVQKFMPSAILERALMLLTERGESRQQAHAQIRAIALQHPDAGQPLNVASTATNPMEKIVEQLPEIREELLKICNNPMLLCGQAEAQTREFVNQLQSEIGEVLKVVHNLDKRMDLEV